MSSEIFGLQTYYDETTGRTLTIVDETEHSVMSYEQLDAIRESKRRQKERMRAGSGRNYVIAYHGPVRKLNDILSLNEIGVIMKLIPYMRFDKGGALMAADKRMGIEEIAKVIGKARRWTVTLIGSLMQAGVLLTNREGKRNVYDISPEYHTIGTAIKESAFTRIYQTKTRTDIANISIQAAGFLYKMIPYIHYEYLYLCCNPNARTLDELRPLSQNRFAEEVGIDKDTASRCMREVLAAGFAIRSETLGVRYIRVNPDIMYRKRPRDEYDEHTEAIREEFRQAAKIADGCEDVGINVDESALPF